MANEQRKYQGLERRDGLVYPCPLHDMFTKGIEKDLKAGEERMQRFESKLDSILDGQSQQSYDIKALKSAIGNGLTKNISETKTCVETLEGELNKVCKTYDKKFIELDDFKWFRDWATGLKNKSVLWAMTFAIIGGFGVTVLAILIYFVYNLKGGG